MNKNVLKNFAINARLELLARVRDRATLYGITDEKVKNNQITASNSFQKLDGQLLSKNEVAQRNALLQRIQNNGYVQVMEEAAYTWFNRFIAIKYMEVHKLLPVDQRVIPQQAGELPQLVREAQNVTLDNIDFDTVAQLLDNNRTEELYKYLVIALCNQLSGCLPQMFERISDYTELLFPDGLMKAESFLGMVTNVNNDDWQEIQVIGWLYQYYNTDLKNETFDLLKKNVKITKDRIGAATQLFTPEWIVRYMVENSLGRLWYEGHPDDNLKAKWRYYLDEAKQEPEVEKQLAEIRKEREKIQPEEIKLIDPCMGSGHILVYAFDLLMNIYRSLGYTDKDAVQSIMQNNLYGLDIDDRAAQLAYFALMMKASEYDKRFLKRNIQPNTCAIQESNSLVMFTHLRGQMSLDRTSLNTANQIITAFVDAKEYGSLLSPRVENLNSIDHLMDQLEDAASNNLEISAWYEKAKILIPQLAKQANILQQSYHVSVTNPPYMGQSGMTARLNDFVKAMYPNGKMDLFGCFIESCGRIIVKNGYQAMITMHSWMFLTTFEGLRNDLLNRTVSSMIHLGARAFEEIGGEVVQTTSFVLLNGKIIDYKAHYRRLLEANTQSGKEELFLSGNNAHFSSNERYVKIPGHPFAYWISDHTVSLFESLPKLGELCISKTGMTTGDNNRFLRLWHEVDYTHISKKWFPYNKGGGYRKWYGSRDYLIVWENDGEMVKNAKCSTIRNPNYYFKRCISWNLITTDKISVRALDPIYVMGDAGPACYIDDTNDYWCFLALLNSAVSDYLLKIINPTINYSCGVMEVFPVCYEKIKGNNDIVSLSEKNTALSKDDWDSFEVSWDFLRHPLVLDRYEYNAQLNAGIHSYERKEFATKIKEQFAAWESLCLNRFNELRRNEEQLNRIFIDAYCLQDELTSIVDEKDVTIRLADLERDIRSLISYAVGCMFGRYSLDVPGLVYAGGEWNPSKYVSFVPDKDGILPITDDDYFQDDVVTMFIRWIKTVYGEESLEENLQFVANALNPKGGTAREVIRNYFMNEFYTDHLKIYQKRPIYWQFESGKQNGFKALMYIHRYDQDTVARLRTDYVHELQDRYRTQLDDSKKTAEIGDARQRSLANKRAQKIDKQLIELNKYEELVHHYADMRITIDLDDGVKANYAMLQDILTKIK